MILPDAEEPPASLDFVDDEEVVYRSLWLEPHCFFINEAGLVGVSGQAFADRNKRISLFRHNLCENPPWSNPPRLGPDQAVARLLARRIREITPLNHQSGTKPPVDYVVDIVPDPAGGQHPSHAVVTVHPSFETNRVFEKLKIRLAQIVEEFSIAPPPDFVEGLRTKT